MRKLKEVLRLDSLGLSNCVGQHFWARGYFVSTVGRDEGVIREYIRSRRRRTKG